MAPVPHKPIRVLALVPTLGQGGAERVLSLLLAHLDRERFAPELALFESSAAAYPLPADVPVHVLADWKGAADPLAIPLPAPLPAGAADQSLWLEGAAGRLAAFVTERAPDVVISSPLWATALVALAADGFPASTRVIHRIDAPPSVPLAEQDTFGLLRHAISSRFNEADGIIAVSGGAAQDLASHFGVDPARITVIHNPADVSRIEQALHEPAGDLPFPAGTPFVLFVGRLEPVKGLDHLVRAFASLRDHDGLHCVMLGEGSERVHLEQLATSLGIAERVHLMGRRANPYSYMAEAAMLVLPSLSEGMSNVLVEAMACGCPIVATEIAGGITQEVLGEDAGLIVPPADETALAEAIERLLADAELRATLADGGRQRTALFSLERIVAAYERELVAACSTDRSARPTRAASALGTLAHRVDRLGRTLKAHAHRLVLRGRRAR